MDKKYKQGLSLLEVVIALGIAAVALGGIAFALGNIVRSAGQIRNDVIAAQLAQEGVEIVRNIRDNNWTDSGRRSDGTDCTDTSVWRFDLCDGSHWVSWDVNPPVLDPPGGGANTLLRLQTDNTYTYNAAGEETPFRREIILTTISSQELRVESIVRWCPQVTASCVNERRLSVEDILVNWFPQ